jgi:DNA-binding response OmpR family regulator
MKRILLVEDDVNLSFMTRENLEDLDYEVLVALSGEEALSVLKTEPIDLVLMDVELSGEMDGFETVEEIRKTLASLPVIFTTCRKSGKDLERGFSLSHVDYVRKPFGIRELSLRINGMLGLSGAKNTAFPLGKYSFDAAERTISLGRQITRLTKMEAHFLEYLCKNKGRIISSNTLIAELWGKEDDPKSKGSSLSNIVWKLRKSLEADASVSLETVSKSGFRLKIKSYR